MIAVHEVRFTRIVLRHLSFKAAHDPERFVAPAASDLRRVTFWLEADEDTVQGWLDYLVEQGEIKPATRIIDGETVYGFICPPAKRRRVRRKRAILTDPDREFLRTLHIAW